MSHLSWRQSALIVTLSDASTGATQEEGRTEVFSCVLKTIFLWQLPLFLTVEVVSSPSSPPLSLIGVPFALEGMQNCDVHTRAIQGVKGATAAKAKGQVRLT